MCKELNEVEVLAPYKNFDVANYLYEDTRKVTHIGVMFRGSKAPLGEAILCE